jgi:hypothetical protein
MLTISKPLSATQAQSYHQREFVAKEQNYCIHPGNYTVDGLGVELRG